MIPSNLPETGYMRVNDILKIIPVARSTFYKWVSEGKLPQPTKFSERISAWPAESIREFLQKHQAVH